MRLLQSIAVSVLAFALTPAQADEVEDQKAVLDVIDSFFAGMTAKDTGAMRKIMTEDGFLFGYRESEEGLAIFNPSHAAYLNDLAKRESVLVERYWDPEILLHDRLAVVWTPYDFHRDGEFSHCGINNFSLLRTDDGWKITGVTFSMESQGCEPSPLGLLRSK